IHGQSRSGNGRLRKHAGGTYRPSEWPHNTLSEEDRRWIYDTDFPATKGLDRTLQRGGEDRDRAAGVLRQRSEESFGCSVQASQASAFFFAGVAAVFCH